MRDPQLTATAVLGPFGVGFRLAGRYEVKGVLGSGGMGTVYRALDVELDEQIALKVLHRETELSRDASMRFRREVKLARRVTHPNVARTYDLGEHQGTRFLTMELIAGESLADRARERLALPEVLRIVDEVARGLAAAHAVGVVHRDLKPDNVMLAGERVVITDFGIARGTEPQEALKTSGNIVGTPAYMAPEQVEGAELDGRCDVFALGVLFFELVTGALPFKGSSALVVATARLLHTAPDARSVDPRVPEGVALLIRDSLSKRREERLDAHGFLERIQHVRGVEGPTSRAANAPRTGTLEWVPMSEGRTVHLAPIDTEPSSERLGHDLHRAVKDALGKERGLSVTTEGRADALLELSVRSAGERVRTRVALSVGSRAVWSDRVDGVIGDPFAIEDDLVERVLAATRRHMSGGGGPADPALRALYDEALAAYERFELPSVRRCIELLDALSDAHKASPWIMTLRGQASVREWIMDGARDDARAVQAEELFLRAIDADPTVAEAYHAISVLRFMSGDYRSARRALDEALRRSPSLAVAHADLGQLACETGHTEEGLRRVAVALRLAPNLSTAHMERARTEALVGDRASAEAFIAQATERLGPFTLMVLRIRLPFWWHDRAAAGSMAALLERNPTGALWDLALPMLKSYAAGGEVEGANEIFESLTAMRVAPRQRCVMHEIAAEYFASSDRFDEVLAHVEAAAALPFIDLLWLDHCPLLEPVRKTARMAEARAVVAARAAAVWT
ncbi:MAG: protein kinase [Polyangiaceae bacterium]|nr:protein kinase [Polyangiaceae bacterium]